MSGIQKIYVDFSVRDPDGRLYVARLSEFDEPPPLGSVFVGTDLDEFEVECRVLAVDRTGGVVYHRPVDATEVPGTWEESEMAAGHEQSPALDASQVREPQVA